MTRWLPRDSTTSLGKIDAEIASIEKKPMRDRSVVDTERLADMREAQRWITNGGRLDTIVRNLKDLRRFAPDGKEYMQGHVLTMTELKFLWF